MSIYIFGIIVLIVSMDHQFYDYQLSLVAVFVLKL